MGAAHAAPAVQCMQCAPGGGAARNRRGPRPQSFACGQHNCAVFSQQPAPLGAPAAPARAGRRSRPGGCVACSQDSQCLASLRLDCNCHREASRCARRQPDSASFHRVATEPASRDRRGRSCMVGASACVIHFSGLPRRRGGWAIRSLPVRFIASGFIASRCLEVRACGVSQRSVQDRFRA